MTAGVPLRIAFEGADLRRFTRLSRIFPGEMRRAQGRAGSIVVRKIRGAVSRLGNADTGRLPPLSPISSALRPTRAPGGVLADPALIRLQNRGGYIHAGAISRVEGVFSRWQDGGSRPLDALQRAWLHRSLAYAGAPGLDVPETATQPERQVIAPIAAVTAREWPRWVRSAAVKLIEKTLGRAGR